MTQETAPAPQADGPEPEPAPKAPQKPRPKMTLEEQAVFLAGIRHRCTMATGDSAGRFAGGTHLYLTEDDVLALETIEQSLTVLALHRADVLVRDKIGRDRRAGSGGGPR
jgi:hypothetical protein